MKYVTYLSISLFFFTCTHVEVPVDRTGGTFHFTIPNSVSTLDPQDILYNTDRRTASLIFEGLVRYDDHSYALEPCLAENWEISEDGCLYIFNLRDTIFFHDDPCFTDGKGPQLTAGDVLFTFERLARKKPDGHLFSEIIKGMTAFSNKQNPKISGIKIIDETHISFELKRPYVSFLHMLASHTAFIVSKEAVLYYGDRFEKHPVGTGAFQLSHWQPLQNLFFSKHRAYWRRDASGTQLPYLDIVHIEIESQSTRTVAGFLATNHHLLQVQEPLLTNLKKDYPDEFSNWQIIRREKMDSRFFGFSLGNGSLLVNSLNLRRAIAWSFNREGLIDTIVDKNIITSASLVQPAFLGTPVANAYSFQPELASELSAKSIGVHRDGVFEIVANLEYPVLEILSGGMRDAGIMAETHIVHVNYYEYIRSERPDIFRVSFAPSYPDPEQFYSLFYSKTGVEFNLCGFSNHEFDGLYEKVIIERNPAKRTALFHQLEEVLNSEVPAIFISNIQETFFLTHSSVKGLNIRFLRPDLSEVWFEKEY